MAATHALSFFTNDMFMVERKMLEGYLCLKSLDMAEGIIMDV